jgi:hypothetical protein
LVPLTRGVYAPLAILALWCALFAVELVYSGQQYVGLHYGLMSWGLLAVFALWLPSVWRRDS